VKHHVIVPTLLACRLHARTHAPLSSASTIALHTQHRKRKEEAKKEQTQDQGTTRHTRASRLELLQQHYA
jgi:hypothetical protein